VQHDSVFSKIEDTQAIRNKQHWCRATHCETAKPKSAHVNQKLHTKRRDFNK